MIKNFPTLSEAETRGFASRILITCAHDGVSPSEAVQQCVRNGFDINIVIAVAEELNTLRKGLDK